MKIKQLVKQKPSQTLPKAHVLGYYNQIVKLQASNSVFIPFMQKAIENFMDKYGAMCEKSLEEISKINHEYLKEKDGVFLKAPNGDPIIREIYTVEQYNKEIEPILNEQIEFQL